MMERAIACTEFISAGAEEKITVMFELYTFKSSLAPTWGAIKQMASILQNCYSERLKGLIIIDPPLWARTMYGLLKPFLDPGEKDKDDVVEREDVSLAFRSLTQPPNLFWFPCCCCCLRVSNPRQIFGGDWWQEKVTNCWWSYFRGSGHALFVTQWKVDRWSRHGSISGGGTVSLRLLWPNGDSIEKNEKYGKIIDVFYHCCVVIKVCICWLRHKVQTIGLLLTEWWVLHDADEWTNIMGIFYVCRCDLCVPTLIREYGCTSYRLLSLSSSFMWSASLSSSFMWSGSWIWWSGFGEIADLGVYRKQKRRKELESWKWYRCRGRQQDEHEGFTVDSERSLVLIRQIYFACPIVISDFALLGRRRPSIFFIDKKYLRRSIVTSESNFR